MNNNFRPTDEHKVSVWHDWEPYRGSEKLSPCDKTDTKPPDVATNRHNRARSEWTPAGVEVAHLHAKVEKYKRLCERVEAWDSHWGFFPKGLIDDIRAALEEDK